MSGRKPARRDLAHLLAKHRPTWSTSTTPFRRSRWLRTRRAPRPVCPSCRRCTTSVCSAPTASSIARAVPAKQCVTRGALPGIVHGCYRDSRVATLGMSLASLVHRPLRTHARRVNRFIALTEFARGRFRRRRNSCRAHRRSRQRARAPTRVPARDAAGTRLFVGRLSEEKGVRTLVECVARESGCQTTHGTADRRRRTARSRAARARRGLAGAASSVVSRERASPS